MNMKDLKKQDRPRERIISQGARALSDIELLAILIGSGTKSQPVFDVASEILKQHSLSELKDLTYSKLIRIKGIKAAKACQLLACFELARRGSKRIKEELSLETPTQIYNYIYEEIYLESNEIVVAILTNCKLKPIKVILERGNTSHQVDIPCKKIISEALDMNAYAVILIHNHPSGDVIPSLADQEATFEFQKILFSLDLILLDHLVVSPTEFYSMHEHGLLHNDLEYSVMGDAFEEINL